MRELYSAYSTACIASDLFCTMWRLGIPGGIPANSRYTIIHYKFPSSWWNKVFLKQKEAEGKMRV